MFLNMYSYTGFFSELIFFSRQVSYVANCTHVYKMKGQNKNTFGG